MNNNKNKYKDYQLIMMKLDNFKGKSQNQKQKTTKNWKLWKILIEI